MSTTTTTRFSFLKDHRSPPADAAPSTAAASSAELTLESRDGLPLAATLTGDPSSSTLVVVNSAMAVPRRYYRHFANALALRGHAVLTWDYRGIGGSRPRGSMRGFPALARDYVLKDMEAVVDWARARKPSRLFLVGHSLGGQLAGMLADPGDIDGMVTFSSQSGYWKLQAREQKLVVAFHQHVTLPGLSTLFGYMPWSLVAAAEDIPKGVAMEWARWGRHPDYLLGDHTLPLERYRKFKAPVLAFSIEDDTWGTARAVDAMMRAYPNVERRHITLAASGMTRIGHFGYFRPESRGLWDEAFAWMDVKSRD